MAGRGFHGEGEPQCKGVREGENGVGFKQGKEGRVMMRLGTPGSYLLEHIERHC